MDFHTLIVVLGFSHLFQVVVFAVQAAITRTYQGIGWWLLWSASATAGFVFMSLRGVPSIQRLAIFGQNTFIVLGVAFLYIGIMRFLGRPIRRVVLATILAVFFTGFTGFLFVTDDILARTVFICGALSAIAFLSAHDLWTARAPSIRVSVTFLSGVFLVHGLLFASRAGLALAGLPVGNFSASTPFNVSVLLDGFMVSALCTVGLVMMVNQRLHAEMREARDRFELLFSTSPSALLITRAGDSCCVDVNRAFEALAGFSRAEILGRTTADLDLYQDPADRRRLSDELRDRGSCEDMEVAFRRKDHAGGTAVVSSRIVPVQGVPHIISVVRDVTERKRTEATLQRNAADIRELNEGLERRVAARTSELQAANENLETLVYSIAHDLRAPLRAIDGFSGILEAEHADRLDEEGRRLLGVVRARARIGDRLINGLLEYSRTADAVLRRERVDMAALAEAAYADLAIPDVQGTFRFTVGRLPEAEGDAILLRIVWSSLLSNAVKYTLPMSERIIVVDGAREGAQVTYSVKDSGVGFDPAHASKLFGVFQRLHGQEEFEGTGIGLAIVKRIVERHGGRVRAEAARKAGATFFFSLPSGGGANA